MPRPPQAESWQVELGLGLGLQRYRMGLLPTGSERNVGAGGLAMALLVLVVHLLCATRWQTPHPGLPVPATLAWRQPAPIRSEQKVAGAQVSVFAQVTPASKASGADTSFPPGSSLCMWAEPSSVCASVSSPARCGYPGDGPGGPLGGWGERMACLAAAHGLPGARECSPPGGSLFWSPASRLQAPGAPAPRPSLRTGRRAVGTRPLRRSHGTWVSETPLGSQKDRPAPRPLVVT